VTLRKHKSTENWDIGAEDCEKGTKKNKGHKATKKRSAKKENSRVGGLHLG